MTETIHIELLSPERRLHESDAEMVRLPGVEGEFGAMPRHAPVVSALRPGFVAVHSGDKIEEFGLTGGFAEVSGDRVLILADEAIPRADCDADALADRARAAEKAGSATQAAALEALANLL